MAAVETMRAVLSARSVLRLGPAMTRKMISPLGTTLVQNAKDDLHLSFQSLTLSPVEMQLSAQFPISANFLNNIKELRLPPLLKPATITFPTLYNGVMLEKDLPSVLNIFEKTDPSASSQKVEAPANQVAEKQAARLIITRRKKMRKHKLKKLRKKMKFVWAKVRQKREYRKEKQFQAEQMAKVRRYDAFDAEEYVKDFLRQTKEKPIPKTWKSKHLPEFLIKELMKKEEEKKIKNRQERLKLEALQKIKDNYKSDLLSK
ncbi:uncharacterized protein LOC123516516 [Portunus trituberculatus]|uniref:uncharacterized protein LOC123516516 n=1 Tax=Portunus trituberculatus TaxID=210409 RepID=UPI001E1CE57D|nr:uncharacterized protein LOC123516516 [Portunus trituberculatus]XP_045131873.1 uncharacterized protein LOC123516516 [Portunus trituberculatus]